MRRSEAGPPAEAVIDGAYGGVPRPAVVSGRKTMLRHAVNIAAQAASNLKEQRMMRRIACLCAALAAMLCLAVSALAQNLTLAAGAGYKKPVTALAKAFEAAGGVKTDLLFGNMGQLIPQAKTSGAIDVMVGEKGFLEGAGLKFSGAVPLGRGVLVVAWPKGKTLTAPVDVAKPEVKRLAMADPA